WALWACARLKKKSIQRAEPPPKRRTKEPGFDMTKSTNKESRNGQLTNRSALDCAASDHKPRTRDTTIQQGGCGILKPVHQGSRQGEPGGAGLRARKPYS